MTVPTVAVTVKLADFGGPAVAGVKITAKPSAVDYTAAGTFVGTDTVSATTDATGLAVLNVFPNAVSPTGLGTVGTTIRFSASMPGSRALKVEAVIPNTACNLVDHVVDQEPNGLGASEVAASQAQAFRDLSKAWATKTDAEVEAGQGFGAKKYAQDAATTAQAAASDRVQTGADRVQTGLDRTQTGQDRTQTGLDRTAADASAAAALASKNAAATSETNAGNSAGAAQTFAQLFDTIALGRAAVADGAYFKVIARGTDNLNRISIYKRTSSTTQTFIDSYVSGTEIKRARSVFSRLAWAVQDATGYVGAGLNLAGEWVAKYVRADRVYGGRTGTTYLTAARSVLSGFLWSVADSAGNIAGGVRADGFLRFKRARLHYLDNIVSAGRSFPSKAASLGSGEFVLVCSYGQSNAVGTGGAPVLTTSQPYGSLMFTSGVITGNGVTPTRTSLIPLAEAALETPVAGLCNGVHSLLSREHDLTIANHSMRFVGSAPGLGGAPIATLNKGTAQYAVFMADVSAAVTLATAASVSAAMRGWMWLQGEADTALTQAAYQTALNQLVNDVDTDVRAAMTQTESVHCFTWQCTHNAPAVAAVAYAQAAIAVSNPLCHVVCPTYFFDFSDTVHIDAVSKKWFGAYAARSYKRVVIDGLPNPELRAGVPKRSGSVLVVPFSVPSAPLVLDTTRVAAHTGMGFQLFQADGVTEIALTSVSLLNPTTVKIIAASAIPAGALLRYGRPGISTADVRNLGARGNLRDSAGEREFFDDGQHRFPLHNWALFFQLTVA